MSEMPEITELEEEALDLNKYLTFTISRKRYAISVGDVAEISPVREIAPVPEFPDYVIGVADIKGYGVPVINPHIRFRDSDSDPQDSKKCIVTVDFASKYVGLLVDKIGEIVELEKDYIQPPPQVNNQAYTRYLQGMFRLNGELVFLLDVPLMINDEDVDVVSSASVQS